MLAWFCPKFKYGSNLVQIYSKISTSTSGLINKHVMSSLFNLYKMRCAKTTKLNPTENFEPGFPWRETSWSLCQLTLVLCFCLIFFSSVQKYTIDLMIFHIWVKNVFLYKWFFIAAMQITTMLMLLYIDTKTWQHGTWIHLIRDLPDRMINLKNSNQSARLITIKIKPLSSQIKGASLINTVVWKPLPLQLLHLHMET